MKLVAALVLAGTAACATATSDDQGESPADTRAPVDVETDTTKPAYGSGYSSNCYCLSCTLYCSVNGKTEKAGTCC